MAKYISLVFLILSSIVTCFITFARLIRLFFSIISSNRKNFRKFPHVPDSEKSFSTEFDSAEEELLTNLKENESQDLPRRRRSQFVTKPELLRNENCFSCNNLNNTNMDQEIISLKKVQFHTQPIPVATSTPAEHGNQNSTNKQLFSISPINRRLNMGAMNLMQSLEPSSAKHDSDLIGVGSIKDNTNRNPCNQKNRTYLSPIDVKHLRSDEKITMLSTSIHPKSQSTIIMKSDDKNLNSPVQFLRNYRKAQEAGLSDLRSNKKKLASSRPIIPKSPSASKNALENTNKDQNTSFLQFLRNNRALQEANAEKELRAAQELRVARVLNLRSGKRIILPSMSTHPKSSSSNSLKSAHKKINNSCPHLSKKNLAAYKTQFYSRQKSSTIGNHSRQTIESSQLPSSPVDFSTEHHASTDV